MRLKLPFALIFILVTVSSFSQDWDCEVIRYEVNCEVSRNSLEEEYHVLLQINNRAGEKYTRVVIPFSGKNKIAGLYAHIEDAEGITVRKLKSSDIKERSAISEMSLYEDDFIKWFELKHNVYPYRIYYTYKISYREFIKIAGWSPALFTELPTHSGKLKIVVPEGYEINVFEQNIANARPEKTDGNLIYTWNESYMSPLKEEVFSPPLSEVIPLVKVTARNFNYGIKGTTESWHTYGDWQYYLNEGLDILPESEQLKVRALINGISDKKEIARKLYHYLQDNTRYISVQIDIGGLRTYPASYVAANKFGDCKALSNYMKSLLNVADIPSYYSLVYADENPVRPIKNFPENQFNHAVLLVPFLDDSVWLECTNKTIPFGFVGSSIQNRPALVIDKGNSHFVNIPAFSADDNVIHRKMNFKNINFTSSDAEITYQLKGESFEMFNWLNSAFNKTEQEEEIRKLIPYSNFELINWKLEKDHRDSAFIELLLELKIPNHGKRYGDEIVFPVTAMNLPNPEVPLKRKLPVRINYPNSKIDEICFVAPNYGQANVSFKDTVFVSPFGHYKITHSEEEGVIKIFKQFTIYSGEYPIDQYSEFYKFIEDIEKLDNNAFIVISK
ncbi:MAG: DUF3857 domain-containing transglutaminase family protein [Bacteroidales bacterium]|nr:DUF3857 domain-containing transglutaminase family protein [Bacteroidales bacterium]